MTLFESLRYLYIAENQSAALPFCENRITLGLCLLTLYHSVMNRRIGSPVAESVRAIPITVLSRAK